MVLKNGLAEPTTIHWHGVDVPNAMDGVPGVTQEPVQPGAMFTYEFEARPAGTRWYHTQVDEHRQLDLGLAGALVIEPRGKEPMAYDREATLVLDDGRRAPARPRRAVMTLAGGMMGSDVWTINGKRYPATDRVACTNGDRVQILLRNMSMEAHPMHLYGQSFRLLGFNGRALPEPLVKDVIDVEAHMGSALLELTARDTGDWLSHCHKPMHMMGGMIALVKVR